MVSNCTSACCTSRLSRGNATEPTDSETPSNYLCTNDGLETGGLPSGGCGDSSAEREFPSDKVYRRNDRGIVGVQAFSGIALRSVSSMPVLDVPAGRAVPASLRPRVLCFHLDVSADHLRFLTDLTRCGLSSRSSAMTARSRMLTKRSGQVEVRKSPVYLRVQNSRKPGGWCGK
jgi:hypothetical protein